MTRTVALQQSVDVVKYLFRNAMFSLITFTFKAFSSDDYYNN